MKFYIIFVFLTCCGFVYANGLARNLPVLSFDEGYSQLFGDDNMIVLKDGSGFVSQDLYLHGYFSASIKLPADYTAGVVVAFYVSQSAPLKLSDIQLSKEVQHVSFWKNALHHELGFPSIR
ncbi:probable xyloglucan endotransglucosylase/hydrolase protein 28 [Tanacetum coccineum]